MSVEKLVMDKGFAPPVAGRGLPRPYKRQGGRRTGLVLLAGACLGGVLVCAVLMPLVYVTMSELQENKSEQRAEMSEMQAEITELRNLVTPRTVPTASPGPETPKNADAAGGAHRERRAADLTPSYGDVYVRWGRKECGEHAETVYSGVVGSGWFNHHGAGSDYQCLPNKLEEIEWDNPVGGIQHSSEMYGAEFEVGSGRFSTDNMRPITNPYHYDVPCSVCHVAGRSTHVMIPARLSCPQGWSKEYSGFLMSSHHGHQNSKNFICVDGAPDMVPKSYENHNGALLYFVEARCGSLPCGPYVEGYELTCVVCTK